MIFRQPWLQVTIKKKCNSQLQESVFSERIVHLQLRIFYCTCLYVLPFAKMTYFAKVSKNSLQIFCKYQDVIYFLL